MQVVKGIKYYVWGADENGELWDTDSTFGDIEYVGKNRFIIDKYTYSAKLNRINMTLTVAQKTYTILGLAPTKKTYWIYEANTQTIIQAICTKDSHQCKSTNCYARHKPGPNQAHTK